MGRRHVQFKQNKLYGREDLLDRLRNVFDNLGSNISDTDGSQNSEENPGTTAARMAEMVLVSGYSGTGKTSLIRKFEDYLLTTSTTTTTKMRAGGGSQRTTIEERIETKKRPCWFISGTFEELKKTPYSAILQAFSAFCVELGNNRNKNETRRVVNRIQRAIGDEGKVLTDMIPHLAKLIGKQSEASVGCSNADSRNRLKFLFQCFVEAICCREEGCCCCPLVLFLDDLQRADGDSLDLLAALMTTPSLAGAFLFIGSFRCNEVNDHHPLALALDEMERRRKGPPEILRVSNLTVDDVNHFISDTLSLDPKQTWSLTDAVYSKTEGNIFYTRQLLEQLHEKEALRYDFSVHFRWVWDVDRIRLEMDLTENVVDVVTSRISQLPQRLQTTLTVAAFIGKCFDLHIVQDFILGHCAPANLMKEESVYYDYDLVELLDMAVEEGLLELEAMGSSTYRFAHDRIQQAARSLLVPSGEKQKLREQIGKYLAKLVFEGGGEDWMIFVAADHLNATLVFDPAATDEEMVALSRLNLIAGEKAVSLSSFGPAGEYFCCGLEVLARLSASTWRTHYELSLKLHRAASESELSIGDFDFGWSLARVVFDNAKNLADKLPTYVSLVAALQRRERCNEAIDLALEALELLGWPKRFLLYHGLKYYFSFKRSLRQLTDDDILSLPVMTDPYQLKTMELMYCLLYLAYLTQRKALFILGVFRVLQFTFDLGLSGPGVAGFAGYGILACGKLHDPEGARRMGILAREIIQVANEKQFKSMTLFTVAVFIDPWFVPLNSVMKTLHTGHVSGMETGDFDMGFRSFFQYQVTAYAAGTPLEKLEKDGQQLLQLMDQYNVDAIRSVVDQFRVLVLTLTGTTIDGRWKDPFPTEGSTMGRLWYIFSRLQLAYFFDDMVLGDELSRMAIDEHLGGGHHYMFVSHALFFTSLIAMTKALETGRRRYWTRVRKLRKDLKNISRTRGFNLLHKYYIVEAQFLAISHGSRKEDKIRAAFDKAISAASKTGFTQDLAIANELAGEYFLRVSDVFWAKHYLSHAYQEYQCWKAHAKVEQILQKHGRLIDVNASLYASTSLLKRRHSIQGEACEKHRSIDLDSLRGRNDYCDEEISLCNYC